MKKFTMIIALIALTGIVNAASIHYEAADSSKAIRIYCGTNTVTAAIYGAGAAATNAITINGTVNTIDGSGSIDTIAELAAAIAACTNASGAAVLTVDTDCALADDSTDGELLTGTYTKDAKGWIEIPWDTSAALHYDVYIPDANAGGIRNTQAKLAGVYGNPAGTGAVTLNIYKDGALVWQKFYAEPSGVSGTNDAIVVISNGINIEEKVNLPIGDKSILIRATRATTATTGMLGASIE